MRIEKVEKKGSKYKITLNNGDVYETFDGVIIKRGLLFDKNIDEDLLEKIKNDNVYYGAYNRVLGLISRRVRSEKEIVEYLRKQSIPDEYIEKMVYNLRMLSLIDDYKYALAYTNDKMHLSLDGPYKIARFLEEQNIDSYIVSEMIDKYPQKLIDEHIKKIITKKVKANKRYTGYVLKQRITAYLLNLGYVKKDIQRHLDLVNYDPTLMEREMERYYKKYKTKFEGQELYYKLKSKLIEKGFRSSDVDIYLEKKQF